MNDLVNRHTELDPADTEWLRWLIGDWQMLSDLSFADLVLWVPNRAGDAWVAVAHCRPSTGATVYYDDVVGTEIPRGRRPQLDRAYTLGRICRDREPEWHEDVPVREETIPVVRKGRTIAVLGRQSNLSAARTPSRLELTYMQCADDLARMIAAGDFPIEGAGAGSRRGAPRVGDGLLRLDREGRIGYASPNGVSALHRLGFVGDVVGQTLSAIVTPLVVPHDPVDESLPLVLEGRAPWRSDLEGIGATLSMRAIPLTMGGKRVGALILVREVSELRRRERELLTKDATIREVHHRVKNNLQTVAALLRLQARRIQPGEGRDALTEAMRRVATIALVHETLSEGLGETVDFDDVVAHTVALAVELAAPTGSVRVEREGMFGELHSENATPLALVLTELVTNAVEHGLGGAGGRVTIGAERDGQQLRAYVRDDGKGLPADFVAHEGLPAGFGEASNGLGMQIVQALVSGEMRGRISWTSPEGGGTEVSVEISLKKLPTLSSKPGTV